MLASVLKISKDIIEFIRCGVITDSQHGAHSIVYHFHAMFIEMRTERTYLLPSNHIGLVQCNAAVYRQLTLQSSFVRYIGLRRFYL